MMGSWSNDPIIVKVGKRSRSHGHIIYAGKMCHNSIMGGHINFILGASHVEDTPNECGTKWLPWQRRLPSHEATKSAIYA